MNKAMTYLSERDAVMHALILAHGEITLDGNCMKGSGALFCDLARAIVGQQLSVRAAAAIWSRVEKLLGGEITPLCCFGASETELKQAGLSTQKVNYLKNLSSAVINGTIELDKLSKLDDEQVINQLTTVKGIGRWTAEMFLIFSLSRPDVFSLGDGGLFNAMLKLYDAALTREKQLQISERWKPYRTYACLLLWASLNNQPNK